MASVLVSWIGESDYKASGPGSISHGRIHNVVAGDFYATVMLLSLDGKKKSRNYRKWLAAKLGVNVELDRCKLADAHDFGEVYRSTIVALEECKTRQGDDDAEFAFLLGNDSPFMDAVLILLAHTTYDAELLRWDAKDGVQVLDVVPADLDALLSQVGHTRAPSTPFSKFASFDAITHQSEVMQQVVATGRRTAKLDVPVLIIGEPGTGRELMARALHKESERSRGPFVLFDTDAVAPEEHDARLFESGSNPGALARARGGIVFIDRIENLSNATQAALFRVMREGRLPDANETELDVRIIASTHVAVSELVSTGTLRDDLFHRLAIGILEIPPLRERQDDLDAIVTFLVDTMRRELGVDLSITPEARQALHNHRWPGNLRELNATLRRAALLGDVIDTEEIRRSILVTSSPASSAMGEIGPGFDIKHVMDDVARHYVQAALAETQGNKTRAATMLGLNNYQTLSNWMSRLGIT